MKHQKLFKQRGFAHIEIIVAILVIVVIGVAGTFVWNKHKSSQFSSAHADSLTYTYGVVLRNDPYATIRACRYYDWSVHSFNAVSVLGIRNTTNTASKYHVGWLEADWSTASDGFDDVQSQAFATNSIGYDYSATANGYWMWGAVWLGKFSTVQNGHNYMGYASAHLEVSGDGRHNNTGYLYDFVHYGAAGSQYTGRYVRVYVSGGQNGSLLYPRLSDLPPCHY